MLDENFHLISRYDNLNASPICKPDSQSSNYTSSQLLSPPDSQSIKDYFMSPNINPLSQSFSNLNISENYSLKLSPEKDKDATTCSRKSRVSSVFTPMKDVSSVKKTYEPSFFYSTPRHILHVDNLNDENMNTLANKQLNQNYNVPSKTGISTSDYKISSIKPVPNYMMKHNKQYLIGPSPTPTRFLAKRYNRSPVESPLPVLFRHSSIPSTPVYKRMI